MRLLILLIAIGLNCREIQKPSEKIIFSVKYVPFSARFNTRVSEDDINKMETKKLLIVKKDTVENDSVCRKIYEKIKELKQKKGEEKLYDIRMECIISTKENRLKFYLDKNKNIIYNGSVYYSQEIADLIFKNICRPYFAYYLSEETKYWTNSKQECNDSTAFFNYYPR